MLYREIFLRLGLIALIVLAGELLVYRIEHARADTIGYRIQVEACGDTRCARIRTPAHVWGGFYACQGRAKRIEEEAAAILRAQVLSGPRPSIRVSAKCAAVTGLPEA